MSVPFCGPPRGAGSSRPGSRPEIPDRVVQRRLARAVVTAIAVLLGLSAVFTNLPAQWLVLEDPPCATDAVLVLAGDPDYERTLSASRLLLSGKTRILFLTGGEPGPGDSAESLRRVALGRGVPAARIRMEQLSHSTHESMLAIRPLLMRDGVRSLTVVSSPYHQRRAVWAARRTLAGVRVISRPASPAAWHPEGWWKTPRNRRIVFGEYAKLVYYGFRGWI